MEKEKDEWLDSLDQLDEEEKARKKKAFWDGFKLAIFLGTLGAFNSKDEVVKTLMKRRK